MKAFPNGTITNKDGLIVGGQQGMDLRDYFAIQYINGIVSHPAFYVQTPFEPLAQMGYSMADAMMKARIK